jgi:tetratricopeptide (TPR) repeat protein
MRIRSALVQQRRRLTWLSAALVIPIVAHGQVSPGDTTSPLKLGQQLDLDGKYAEARQDIAKAIDMAPADKKVGALRTMAISYAFTCNAADAAKYEEQAIAAQTSAHDLNASAEIANELARIYLECGDPKSAYRWYQTGNQTALKIPLTSDSAKDLWAFRWEHAEARVAAREGHAADAQKHVAAAKAILDKGHIPDQARFLPYLTGYVALYGGDYKTAIADLQTADQRDPFILSLLAQAYEKSGQSAQATDLYRKILAINVHNPTNAFARPLAKQKLGSAA